MITQQTTEHVPVEGSVVEHAISVAVSIIEQAIGFLDIVGTDERLTYPSQAIPGGTIGKHIRHVADHYNLLLKVNMHLGTLAFLLLTLSIVTS
jgi:hypothetical protein